MSAPFFAIDAERWGRMIARLRSLGSLEEDDARTDLRFWENEHRVWMKTEGKHGAQFPGRRALMDRWGWKERAVRSLLEGDDWHDPNFPVSAADLRRDFRVGKQEDCPAPAPPLPRDCPADQRTNADNNAEMPRACPAPAPSMSNARASIEPRSTTEPPNHETQNATAEPAASSAPRSPDALPPHPSPERLPRLAPLGRADEPHAHAAPVPGVRAVGGVEAPARSARPAEPVSADQPPARPSPSTGDRSNYPESPTNGTKSGRPEITPTTGERQQSGERVADTLPTWVPPARSCHGHDRGDVMALVVNAATLTLGKPRNPHACGTSAGPVLALWRKLGMPPPAELAADLAAVIEWAQRSPDRMAARDIRGEGWPPEDGGADRSRALSTLCTQERWDARLDAARRWADAGRPTGAPVVPMPRGRDAPRSRADERREALSALEAAILRAQERENAEGINDPH